MSDSNIWVSDIQTKAYSRAKAILTASLGDKYPSLYITDDDETPTEPQFPTVYIHFLEPAERGQDLEGSEVNAIYLTAEVEVTVTKAQGMRVCKEVSYVALDAFKSMRFQATMPAFKNDGSGTKRMIARYARTIGSNDKLY